MNLNSRKLQLFGRILTTLLLVGLYIGVYVDLNARMQELIIQSGRVMRSYLIFGIFVALAAVVMLLQVWTPGLFGPLRRLRARLGMARWVLALLMAAGVSYFFLYSKWSNVFSGSYVRLLVFLFTLGLMAWVAVRPVENSFEWEGFFVSIVLLGSVFSFVQVFNSVVSYPFSIGWSEGNRLWDYSILYGRRFYIFPANQNIFVYTDKMRQSIWGLPYLAASMTITQARLWSALVWTVPYILLGWVFLALYKKQPRGWLIFGLWVFLFLNQGPIYTPLILAAILVAGSRRMPLGWSLAFVIVASTYARLARYTWLFAPGIWAFVIALLQTRGLESLKAGWRQYFKAWSRPILLAAAGIVGSVLATTVAYLTRGEDLVNVVSSDWISSAMGRQALLWDRLWPNSTNSLGIVYGLLLAAGPLVVLLVFLAAAKRWRLDLFQKLVLVGSQLAFLGVGMVASVKIGGGSNLHNLDMFLVGLVFAAGLAYEAGLRDWIRLPGFQGWSIRILVLFIIVYPASQGMMTASPIGIPAMPKAAALLEKMQKPVADAAARGDVLFLDQRQLLTFGFIKNVPLVPDYEKKLLMDEAMAGDTTYFARFNQDMKAHRFSLIVSEPLYINYRGTTYEFGNENDAWVKWVSIPILCNYQPILTDTENGVQLLAPIPETAPAPDVVCP